MPGPNDVSALLNKSAHPSKLKLDDYSAKSSVNRRKNRIQCHSWQSYNDLGIGEFQFSGNSPIMNRAYIILVSISLIFTAGLEAKNYNVLFIMADDLNCDLGVYGHPQVQTPNIDRLANEGMLFENAFCNFPLCGPSRASFMTGLYPEQNGVTKLRRLFRYYTPNAVTLSQHFKKNGYTAARVGKIYHFDNPNGIGTNGHDDPDSWDIRINPKGRDKVEEDKIFSLIPGKFGATLSWLAADGEDTEQTDGMVATESIHLLRKLKKEGKPFFLGVGFYKPHTPFVAPKKYFELYDPTKIEVPCIPSRYHDSLPAPAVKRITAFESQNNLPEETAREAIHAYYATISFLDAQIGRVLDELEKLGLKENTIVLFSSDHGYHMGEHGHYQKNTLFENADRVPLIISYPGMDHSGARSESLVEMIDFYKTLSHLAGIDTPPSYIQGHSLVPVLKNPEHSVRETAITQLDNGYTIRTNRYRYTKWPQEKGLNIELYDRLSDPGEMMNIATDPNYNDVVEKLDHLWQKRVEEIGTIPSGLNFIPPKKGDGGVHRDEYKALEEDGKLPRYAPQSL